MNNNAIPQWQQSYFSEAYLEIYSEHLYDKKQITSEVDFVIKTLRLGKSSRLLDLACGFGKHLNFFLKKGIRAVGLDISLPYLVHARRNLPKTALKRSPLVCATMTSPPFAEDSFDAVVSLFNSFGYRPMDVPDPDLAALKEVCRILKPGGRFLLELPNKQPVVSMVRSSPQTIQCGHNFIIHEFWDFDPKESLIYNRTSFNARGKISQAGYCLRLFTKAEIEKLFKKAGFVIEKELGDYDGSSYGRFESPYLIMVGRKKD